ncbi:MAG: carbohydrate porin [Xanthomonadaceae bacterium]|nr:carbohydrate porin [Xanthomonadaceae bacterium]MDE1963139.1 carbohydrate porin [Xanthomonadaceae bacterium]
MTIHPIRAAILATLCATASLPARAGTDVSAPLATAVDQKIAQMQARIDELQKELLQLKQAQAQAASERSQAAASRQVQAAKVDKLAKAADASADGIHVGGAMRFQYSYEDYSRGNRRRLGDADFDIFRLNLRGKVDNIELQAEWRWFQYMSAIKYAWLGYDFGKHSQVQAGITRIPFGNQPYDSHNYFFSSNYYLGLEDTYHAGVEYVYAGSPWNVQLAFFKNDAMGGVDGYVSNRTDSYSYNVLGVRAPGEGLYDAPRQPAGSANTAAARVAYTFHPDDDLSLELGASALHGGLEGKTSRIGHYDAYAVHLDAHYLQWNVQAQAAHYGYHTDSGATRLAVGAYHFYDTIAARADSYTFNVKYHQPVQWGPIRGLDFYNDYSLVTHKSGMLRSTVMNVLGVGVSAGDLYTYFDYVIGRNQPFVGGSMAGDGGVEHRVNINVGFYF